MQSVKPSFHFNEYTAESNGLSLCLYLSHSKNSPANSVHTFFPIHTHTFVEVFACFCGGLSVKTEGKQYLLSAGDLLLVPAGVPHFCEGAQTEDTRFCSFGYFGAPCATKECFDLYAALLPLLAPKEVLWFHGVCALETEMKKILQYAAEEKNNPYPSLAFALFLEGLLSRLSDLENENSSLQKDGVLLKETNRLFLFHELLISHYSEPLTVKEIAAMLYMSPRQLERVVKKHYGSSVRSMFLERRLSLAERMLEETEKAVEEIALSVGFGDAASFTRAFTQKYGMSPGRYRKQK